METTKLIRFSTFLIFFVIIAFAIWPLIFQKKHIDIGEERVINVDASIKQLIVPDVALKTCIDSAAQRLSDINPLSSGGIDRVQQLKNLDCFRSGIISLKGLSSLNNLRHLDLQQNKIKDISEIKYLKNLKTLNLKDNPIASISPLSSLKDLQQLHLPDLPKVYCYEVLALSQGIDGNAKSIYCKGKYNSTIKQLLQKEALGSSLSREERRLISDYQYNKALMPRN